MANVDGGAIMEEMLAGLPEGEIDQETKDKNPYQFKYEVKLKKLPKKLKSVLGLKVGKIGRVIEVIDDKNVIVDFWDTRPAKFPVNNRYLELERTREDVERASGTFVEPSEEPTKGNTRPVKYDAEKPRMDLIRPEFTLALGEVLGYGSVKYDEKRGELPNYLKGGGFEYSKIIGSLERHIAQWKMGENFDEESGKHHLALAAANLMFLYTYEISDKGIDDRVKLEKK